MRKLVTVYFGQDGGALHVIPRVQRGAPVQITGCGQTTHKGWEPKPRHKVTLDDLKCRCEGCQAWVDDLLSKNRQKAHAEYERRRSANGRVE